MKFSELFEFHFLLSNYMIGFTNVYEVFFTCLSTKIVWFIKNKSNPDIAFREIARIEGVEVRAIIKSFDQIQKNIKKFMEIWYTNKHFVLRIVRRISNGLRTRYSWNIGLRNHRWRRTYHHR